MPNPSLSVRPVRGLDVKSERTTSFVALSALLLLFTLYAPAQTLTALHYFSNGQDGEGPMTGVAVDHAGNVYGTTTHGGNRGPFCADGGCGVVYRASLKNGSWIFTPLYDFQGNDDGSQPQSSVTVGPDGALYGTTSDGGGGGGTIYRLTPPARLCHQVLCSWTETIIYRFHDDPNGLHTPYGGVIFDSAGAMYGFASNAIYKLTRAGSTWTLAVLYRLRPEDGQILLWEPTMDAAGNIYGSAEFGGIDNNGTVFRLVRSGDQWTFELLYALNGGSDGAGPWGVAIPDSAGNVFGATSFNGGVFELTPSGGSWSYSVIAPIRGGLEESINLGPDGNVYGTMYSGDGGVGSVWKLSRTQSGWTRTVLHSFQGRDDGALPESNVVFDAQGNMYGTTTMGGHYGYGTVWQLTPQ
jgi:uncharacterized repeat protein (TIGR03803 family)